MAPAPAAPSCSRLANEVLDKHGSGQCEIETDHPGKHRMFRVDTGFEPPATSARASRLFNAAAAAIAFSGETPMDVKASTISISAVLMRED
jgi:hypothetical protein